MSSPKASLTLPAAIDRYQLRAVLGGGSFGTVYRAVDARLNREVALKVLRPEMTTSKQAVERFLREAKAAAKLFHPHIVPVYDAGLAGKLYYIASAFIRGKTLAAVIPQGGMEPHRAAELAAQLALALGYAHGQGVLHRDVKPANIMLDEQGSLYLTDFGMAAWVQDEGTRLTQEGAIIGTPKYLSPEQASGDTAKIGAAADLYAAGVVLYELLTGRTPFGGPIAALVYQIVHKAADPPSQHRPGLDERWDAVCMKALAKDPSRRYGSGEEMAAVLRRVGQRIAQSGAAAPAVQAPVRGRPPEKALAPSDDTPLASPGPAAPRVAPVRPRRISRRPWMLLCVASLTAITVLAGATGVLYFRSRPSQTPTGPPVVRPDPPPAPADPPTPAAPDAPVDKPAKPAADLRSDQMKAAIDALVTNAGPQETAQLLKFAKDEDPKVRVAAWQALGKVGNPTVHSSIAAMLQTAGAESDAGVRKTALEVLSRLVGPENQAGASALYPLLTQQDPDTRYNAAIVLGLIGGPAAVEALPSLREVLNSGDPHYQELAAAAAGGLGPEGEPVVDALGKLMTEAREPSVRINAAVSLAHIGPPAVKALPQLMQALRYNNAAADAKYNAARIYAAEALINVKMPRVEPAIPDLLEIIRADPDPQVRQRCLWVLFEITDLDKYKIAPVLTAVLDETAQDTALLRYDAARVLALRLREKAPDKTTDVLLDMLSNKSLVQFSGSNVKPQGVGGEGDGGKTKPSEETGGDARWMATEALGWLGRKARRPDVIKALQDATQDKDAKLRDSATKALALINGQ